MDISDESIGQKKRYIEVKVSSTDNYKKYVRVQCNDTMI